MSHRDARATRGRDAPEAWRRPERGGSSEGSSTSGIAPGPYLGPPGAASFHGRPYFLQVPSEATLVPEPHAMQRSG